MHICLADGLNGVVVEAFAQFIGNHAVGRPDSDDVLQQEVAGGIVRGGGDGHPVADIFSPVAGDIGELENAGADIFAALGVVRGQRGHGSWPEASTFRLQQVELRRRHAVATEITADFV